MKNNKTRKHITLKERFEKYYGKPINKIRKLKSSEIDFGSPVGKEVW